MLLSFLSSSNDEDGWQKVWPIFCDRITLPESDQQCLVQANSGLSQIAGLSTLIFDLVCFVPDHEEIEDFYDFFERDRFGMIDQVMVFIIVYIPYYYNFFAQSSLQEQF